MRYKRQKINSDIYHDSFLDLRRAVVFGFVFERCEEFFLIFLALDFTVFFFSNL